MKLSRAFPNGVIYRDQHEFLATRCGSLQKCSQTDEQWIKGGKYELNWTRLSCKLYVSNLLKFCLLVVTYKLDYFLRWLVIQDKIKH